MDINALQQLIDSPRDSAMLRLTLAKQLLELDQLDEAVKHLKRATEMQPDYSAAWKWLGKSLQLSEQHDAARQAYTQGINAARSNGDKQSEKEMQVFLRRLPSG